MSPERSFCSITGSCPSWAPELVDAELAAAQLPELGVENVRRDAVARGVGLIVAEAEFPLLRASFARGAQRQQQCRGDGGGPPQLPDGMHESSLSGRSKARRRCSRAMIGGHSGGVNRASAFQSAALRFMIEASAASRSEPSR